MEHALEHALREPLAGQRILEVGPGQNCIQMRYFATRVRIVRIDLDVVAEGFDPAAWWRMLRRNGAYRLLKTLGRKALGIDRRFALGYARQLGARSPERLDVLQRDAARSGLPDASVDCVISFSVFQHLEDPRSVMREIARLLRPGGVAYIATHLYHSDTGCHDPRLYSGKRHALPHWSHLRPKYRDRVQPNTYLNEISLADWRELFVREWPEATLRGEADMYLPGELERLRTPGELSGYADEELLTRSLIALWKKPPSADRTPR